MILHNLTKVKLFRVVLWMTYPLAAIIFLPLLLRRRNSRAVFFFFDRYSIGGAQKIHLDVLESVKDIPKTVFFTRKSPDSKLKNVFYSVPNTVSKDVHFWCDNLLFRIFSVHYFSFLLNSYQKSTILSSNSTFFYDMLPFINPKNDVFEILHNFTFGKKGMEFFGLANHRHIDVRIVYDTFTLQNMQKQYQEYHIAGEYKEKIRYLEYGVNIPDVYTVKTKTPPLKVLYAGRGAAQKRIWLLNRIAEQLINEKENVQFIFAGSMVKELSDVVKSNSIVYGEIGDQNKMKELFSEAHVIILTSAFEGFPVVIKEGMSFGCIPLATALPGNKSHLKHLQNALLIENFEDEAFVVAEGIRHLQLLINNPELVQTLSRDAYEYAKQNFTKDRFLAEARKLLLESLTHST